MCGSSHREDGWGYDVRVAERRASRPEVGVPSRLRHPAGQSWAVVQRDHKTRAPGYDSGMAEARARTSARREPRAGSREESNPLLYCALGLAVPGLGHIALGRRGTGAVFLVSIGLLFFFGIRMEGELFPFEAAAPLTLLAGLAEMGAGAFYVAARMLGLGAGNPEAPTYEYGYAFLIVAGLLNMLVVLDAWDIGTGAKESADDTAAAGEAASAAR